MLYLCNVHFICDKWISKHYVKHCHVISYFDDRPSSHLEFLLPSSVLKISQIWSQAAPAVANDERFVGRYEFLRPVVMIRDIELIKKICVKDIDHFLDHRVFLDVKVDPFFGRNIFSLKGQEWKDMRSTLSPAFTSSKIRSMVTFMNEVGEQMLKSLKMKLQNTETGFIDVDCRDLTTRYANDVIASCAFGLKVDSHTDRNNIFYKMANLASTFNFKELLKFFALDSWPFLNKTFNITMFPKSTTEFFKKLVMNSIAEREAKQIIRPDMIHLLMEAKRGNLRHKSKGAAEKVTCLKTGEDYSTSVTIVDRVWSDDDLVAQAMLFILGGFDTISSSTFFALYELAMHPEIQERLAMEIKEHNAKNGGRLDYNTILDMTYLDMVVSEVLRIWSLGIVLERICTKDYNLGKTNEEATQDYIVRKGESVMIPVWAIHHDPKYYPDPEKFDPERFSEENKHLIKPFTYMPFGLGVRNCLGSRFALCEVKVILYQLLLHMEISPCEKTCVPAKLTTNTFLLRLRGGHWLRFRPRQE
ncbi:unnamed protein product [Parnassius apollo]|uniref:unspecific monooxygenase n=1 Tax=Parnassius apollo TaxID=110799 RepID=A0A8S3XQL6_PARAO|nr:unnamed protein product [Parnassius apollo]